MNRHKRREGEQVPSHNKPPASVTGAPAREAMHGPDAGYRARFSAVCEHVPFGVVALVALIAVVRVVQYHWREGSALLGSALLVAAVFRATLPKRRAGLLAVRSRVVDVVSYCALAGCVLFIALTIQGGPLS